MMWMFYILITFAVISTTFSIVITPGETTTEGDCYSTDQLQYFLCNCLTSNTSIDIHLLTGNYNFTNRSICLLENKTSITITGSTAGDTVIECTEPFSIVFMSVRNVTIANIKMINCGNVVNDVINKTVNEHIPLGYFGNGFRFVMMFDNTIGVTVARVTMLNTLGYGIIAFNMIEVLITELHIENTTFENDLACINQTYKNSRGSFYCSGSGLLFVYFDPPTSIRYFNSSTVINKSSFKNNRNVLPFKEFDIFRTLIETISYKVPIPIQGAGSIAIFYLQNSFHVHTKITDTLFQNNTGTLSGAVAVTSVSTTSGKSHIENCTFLRNSIPTSIHSKSDSSLQGRGGLSYYYLAIRNSPGMQTPVTVTEPMTVDILTIRGCKFTETFGEAIHIEKTFLNLISVRVNIKNCTFSHNVANAGSAVVAIDRTLDSSFSKGDLIVYLENVHAANNDIFPDASISYDSVITGVFSSLNVAFTFNCSDSCTFLNNRPSVYYGRSSFLFLFGNAIFYNNSAHSGGALRLEDTVVFVYENAELYFHQNSAVKFGGAININFFNTNEKSQDICPIQFIRPDSTDVITQLNDTDHDQFKTNITFEDNTVGASSSLQSINANVFYLCTWYPNSIFQISICMLQDNDGKKVSVYDKVFQFIPNSSDHLSILAYIPCPCYKDDKKNDRYNPQYCLSAADNNSFTLDTKVTLGQSFYVNLIALDVVGFVGHADILFSQVHDPRSTTNSEALILADDQDSRPFPADEKSCVLVEYTIFGQIPNIPEYGVLRLSYTLHTLNQLNFYFNIVNCSIGFSLQLSNGVFACVCGDFFMEPNIENDFQCNSVSSIIIRKDRRSWLSVVNDKVEYVALCSPVYCNDVITNYMLTDNDILCDNNHAGRACGGCVDHYGRVFGSNSCKQCSNAWLATILLFAILGIILVMILYLLRLTVTMGTINGLIFFCNVMSINERLFFNTEDSQFLFLRVFISLINLDLGFEMCFYHEMSQIAKTGLQFVFPVYLWLLLTVIIISGRYYLRSRQSSSRTTAVPVLATLILLSYSKLLRTTVSVFSYASIQYTTKESNYSISQQLSTWQADPNVGYLQGSHIVLFLIALMFMLFIIPFAFVMTFPTIILRSKRMSRLFPLLDCFYAPYKDKYRYWFGARLIVLIYLSGMENIILPYQEAYLLSSATVLFGFIMLQAYILPFKNAIINILDLLFMGLFILLSMITLYLYPSVTGYDKVNSAVNICYMAFLLFCLVVGYHIHTALKRFTWYGRTTDTLITKSKLTMKDWKLSQHLSLSTITSSTEDKSIPYDNYSHYRESLLEHL